MRAGAGPVSTILAALALSACVSSGEVKMTGAAQPVDPPMPVGADGSGVPSEAAQSPASPAAQAAATTTTLPARPSVMVVIQPLAKGSDRIRDDLAREIAAQLRAAGRYSAVSGQDSAADLIMTVTITDYRRVSVGARLVAGVFAGKNRVVARVGLNERTSGAALRSFEVTGESSFTNFSSMGDAVRQVARHIATVKVP